MGFASSGLGFALKGMLDRREEHVDANAAREWEIEKATKLQELKFSGAGGWKDTQAEAEKIQLEKNRRQNIAPKEDLSLADQAVKAQLQSFDSKEKSRTDGIKTALSSLNPHAKNLDEMKALITAEGAGALLKMELIDTPQGARYVGSALAAAYIRKSAASLSSVTLDANQKANLIVGMDSKMQDLASHKFDSVLRNTEGVDAEDVQLTYGQDGKPHLTISNPVVSQWVEHVKSQAKRSFHIAVKTGGNLNPDDHLEAALKASPFGVFSAGGSQEAAALNAMPPGPQKEAALAASIVSAREEILSGKLSQGEVRSRLKALQAAGASLATLEQVATEYANRGN
jgi:hypothetical protein